MDRFLTVLNSISRGRHPGFRLLDARYHLRPGIVGGVANDEGKASETRTVRNPRAPYGKGRQSRLHTHEVGSTEQRGVDDLVHMEEHRLWGARRTNQRVPDALLDRTAFRLIESALEVQVHAVSLNADGERISHGADPTPPTGGGQKEAEQYPCRERAKGPTSNESLLAGPAFAPHPLFRRDAVDD